MAEVYLGKFSQGNGVSSLTGRSLYGLVDKLLSFRPNEGEGRVELISHIRADQDGQIFPDKLFVIKTLIPHQHNQGALDTEIWPEHVLEKHKRLVKQNLNVTDYLLFASDTQSYLSPNVVNLKQVLFDKHVVEDNRAETFRKLLTISPTVTANIHKKLLETCEIAYAGGVFLGVDSYAVIFNLSDVNDWKIYLLDLGYGCDLIDNGKVVGYTPVDNQLAKSLRDAQQKAEYFYQHFLTHIIQS